MAMQYDEYWLVPGVGKVTALPRTQISADLPIPTRWADSIEQAKQHGAIWCRDERLPAYHSHPGSGASYVEETVAGVRTRTLDRDHLVYDVDAHFRAARAAKQAEIIQGADNLLATVGAEYGAMERTGWDQQYAEATAYEADNAADVPMLTAMAAARSVEVAYLAGRIIANRATWIAVYGAVIGTRQAYQDVLDAAVAAYEAAQDDEAKAAAIADIEAIEVTYSLPEAE